MLQKRNIFKNHAKAQLATVAVFLSALLAAGACVIPTQAYLMSKTETYVNTFVSDLPEVGRLTIYGTKVLEGRSLACGEFGFELYETNSDFVVSNNAEPLQVKENSLDGAFSFDEIEYTEAGVYYYVVSEQVPDGGAARPFVTYDETEYHVTVTVSEEDNALAVEKSVIAYKPESVVVDSADSPDVEADSNVEGEADLEGGQVQESEDTSNHIEEADSEAIVFTNQFESPNAIVVVNGLKLLDGRELKAGEFVFDLYEVDSTYQLIEGSDPIRHAMNLTGGWFGFIPLSYEDEGTFYYVISERAPSAGEDMRGISYDTSMYRLQVDVQRNAETGILFADVALYIQDENGSWIETEEPSSMESASELSHYVVIDPQNATGALAFITFENSYSAKPVSTTLAGSVDLIGRDMVEEEFSFVVEPAEGAPTFDCGYDGNDSDGLFLFGSVEFTEPGVYEYVVKQDTSAQLEGVVYDEAVYRAIVVVIDDGAGNLVVESVVVLRDGVEVTDGSGVKYVNTYTKPSVDDPDDPVVPPGSDEDEPDAPGAGDGDGPVIPGGSDDPSSDLGQTGDDLPVFMLSGIALAAIVIAGVAFIMRRRSHS